MTNKYIGEKNLEEYIRKNFKGVERGKRFESNLINY